MLQLVAILTMIGTTNAAVSVPDMELAYRRSLSTNEIFRCEVISRSAVADAGARFVSLRWRNESGQVVADFGPSEIGSANGSAVSFEKRADLLGDGRLLKPELVVTGDGRTSVVSDGLVPVSLSAVPRDDFIWMRIPLRSGLSGIASTVTIGDAAPDGTHRVSGRITGATPIVALEALEDGEVVYRAGDSEPGVFCVRLSMSCGAQVPQTLNGFIGIHDVGDLTCGELSLPQAHPRTGGWIFRDARLSACEGFATFAAEMPDAAEIVVELKGVFSGRVRVKDLKSKGSVELPGSGGATLCFERWLKPVPWMRRPSRLDSSASRPSAAKSVDVDFLWLPKSPNAILTFQATDAAGNVVFFVMRMAMFDEVSAGRSHI